MSFLEEDLLLFDPSEPFLIDENFHIDLSEFEPSDEEEKSFDISALPLEELDLELPVKEMKEVHIRTHKGSGGRHINLQMLQEVGHLPQQKAADALKIGNTRFKTATRQLGMKGWPYRKIKSILNLIKTIEEHREYFGDTEANKIIGKLKILKTTIFHAPDTPLSLEYKKFRQTAYKLTHATRKRKSITSGKC